VSENTTINLEVNSDIKEQAGDILGTMGLTLNDAFNLMLYQIKIRRCLPFNLVSYSYTPKNETYELIERIENGEEELIGPFASKEDLWRSLDI